MQGFLGFRHDYLLTETHELRILVGRRLENEMSDEDEEETLWLNHYKCSHCGTEWSDEWSCQCNDRCPKCGAETEPYQSEEISDEEDT